jgi:hypothetical protein
VYGGQFGADDIRRIGRSRELLAPTCFDEAMLTQAVPPLTLSNLTFLAAHFAHIIQNFLFAEKAIRTDSANRRLGVVLVVPPLPCAQPWIEMYLP